MSLQKTATPTPTPIEWTHLRMCWRCVIVTRWPCRRWHLARRHDSLCGGLGTGGRNGGEARYRSVWGRAAEKKGQRLLDRLVLRRTVTVRRLGDDEAGEKAFWRFLRNERVSERALIAAARAHLLPQVAGRRVLAIQDTSEINFSRQKRRKASFGRGGNGT